jgi:hypothetical protein
LGAELVYVPLASWCLPSAFAALARRHDLELRVVHFRSWYPGDVRANSLVISGQDEGIALTSQAIRGRIELSPLLSGTLAFAFLKVSEVAATVTRRQTTLARGTEAVRPPSNVRYAGLLGLPDLERLRLDTAELDVRAVQVGTLRLAGRLVLRFEKTTVSTEGGRVHATATLRGVSAPRPADERGEALGDLAGKFSLELTRSPTQALAPARWRGATRGELNWRTASLSDLLDSGPDWVVTDARLAFELHGVGTTPAAGSFAELHARELRAPPLPFESCNLVLREARIRVEGDEPAGAPNQPGGSLSAQSPSADLFCGESAGAFAVEADTRFRLPESKDPSVALESGTIHARRSGPVAPSGSSSALNVTLSLSRASWSRSTGLELGGALTARGPDAGSLLTLAHADPGARWMLNELVGQPFAAKLALSFSPARLAFERVELETDSVAANGAVAIGDDGAHGAFLVERGRLNLGVQVTAGGLRLETAPTRVWLRQSLQPFALAP